MAAIRAELPLKPLPPEAADAAPPCDVAFALERVEVLTKLVLSPGLARHKNEDCVLSSQKEDDPLPIRGRFDADGPFRNLGWGSKQCTSAGWR
jgi:hypothetical protein